MYLFRSKTILDWSKLVCAHIILNLSKLFWKGPKMTFQYIILNVQICFLCMHFYLEWYNFYNKNCLFNEKIFEFEVKSYSPFFSVASSLSTLWLLLHWQWLVHLVETQPIEMIMLLLNSLCDFILLGERAIYQSSLHLLIFIGGTVISIVPFIFRKTYLLLSFGDN